MEQNLVENLKLKNLSIDILEDIITNWDNFYENSCILSGK